MRLYQINEILVLYIIVPFFPELPGIQNGFNSSPEYTARGGGALIVWLIPMSGCKHFNEFSIELFYQNFKDIFCRCYALVWLLQIMFYRPVCISSSIKLRTVLHRNIIVNLFSQNTAPTEFWCQ